MRTWLFGLALVSQTHAFPFALALVFDRMGGRFQRKHESSRILWLRLGGLGLPKKRWLLSLSLLAQESVLGESLEIGQFSGLSDGGSVRGGQDRGDLALESDVTGGEHLCINSE